MTPGRDVRDEDAIALDLLLDDLVAGDAGGPTLVGAEPADHVDPDLARAARVVGAALARFHPSFRFEERLSTRLRETAAAQAAAVHALEGGVPMAAAPAPRRAGGVVIPFGMPGQPPRSRSRRVNGAIIGGAISAGVSLASIAAGALMARRRGRGDTRWERVG